ncbi:MAG: ABC transporter ATP-binding protein [Chitinispirillaceae bacterium]
MNREEVLSFKDVSKVYRRGAEQVHAVEKATLIIEKGEYAAVSGPSGSGKTTMLNMMGCLDYPSSGEVKIDGTVTSSLPEKELVKVRRKAIGFVFQQFFLIPTLTVLENVELPLLFCNQSGKSRAEELLETVGLGKRMKHLPSQLSGGEMQRVAIARSLINKPSLLLADEPTGNLDSKNAALIMDLFEKLNSNGLTIVVVTHNNDLVKRCGKVIQIEDGKLKN